VSVDAGSLLPPRSVTGDLLDGPPGLGRISGGLTDGPRGLGRAHTVVRFRVDTGRTLLGAVWVLAVLAVALLATRRTPLPPGWEWVHRVVRPRCRPWSRRCCW